MQGSETIFDRGSRMTFEGIRFDQTRKDKARVDQDQTPYNPASVQGLPGLLFIQNLTHIDR